MKKDIKLVEENNAKKSQKPEFKVTPSFSELTPTGIKMLTNMGDIEIAKLYIDDLVMDFGGDTTNIHFLMVLLEAIDKKIKVIDYSDHPSDFINLLQHQLFNWTGEVGRIVDAHIEALTSGNVIIHELTTPESENEPDKSLKAVA